MKYVAKMLALAAHKQPLAQRVAWPLQENDTQSHPYLKHPYLKKHLQTQRANKTTVKFQRPERTEFCHRLELQLIKGHRTGYQRIKILLPGKCQPSH